MNDTAATFISGSDGSYFRTSSAGITAATLFTASAGPSGTIISWTPTQAGDFWYTCTVTSHPGMTGKITVIPEPSSVGLIAGGFVFAAFRRRRVK